MSNERAIVFTTKHRGVFFGYSSCSLLDERVIVRGLRNCLTWSKTIGGVFGLATVGPNTKCVIGETVTGNSGIQDVTWIGECSPEAEKAWLEAKVIS